MKDLDSLIVKNVTVNIKKDSTINVEGNTTLTCKGNIQLAHSNNTDSPLDILRTPEQKMVFGDELQTQLEILNRKVDTVVDGVNAALTQSVPAPTDGGATLKATMLIAWQTAMMKLKISKALAITRFKAGIPNLSPLEPTFDYILNNNITTKGTAG